MNRNYLLFDEADDVVINEDVGYTTSVIMEKKKNHKIIGKMDVAVEGIWVFAINGEMSWDRYVHTT